MFIQGKSSSKFPGSQSCRSVMRHESHQFVIVSGLPASGKTTLASALALKLDFPFLDKDSLLEALFAAEGTGNSEWRRDLSRRADMSFREAALARRQAVLTSWWRHPRSTVDSGTPTDWLPPVKCLVEVHCACSASVAAARFLARARHHGHLDHQRSAEGLLSMLEEQQDFGPLFPSRAIVVDTEREVALSDLAAEVQRRLHESGDGQPASTGGPASSSAQ